MNNSVKSVHLLLNGETRLALKLLSAINDLNMSQMVTKLIMRAYNEEKIAFPKEKMKKVRKVIKKFTKREVI